MQQYDLWYIVSSVKADLELDHTKHDMTFFKWAVDGFRDINRAGILPTYKTIRLKLNHDNTAYVPPDYIEYNKIGQCLHGKIINFTACDNLCLVPPKLDCCLDIVKEIKHHCGEGDDDVKERVLSGGWWDFNWYYLPSFHNGQFVAGIYGLGEGFSIGGFQYDPERRLFKFDHHALCSKEIILEYKSSGGIENGNTYIPESVIACLCEYVHWRRCLFTRDPVEKQNAAQHKRNYQRQVKRVVASLNAMTKTEIIDIVRASIRQSPKR